MKRILIADDHKIVRDCLIKAISAHFPDIFIGEANNSSKVLEKLRDEKWDLLILDLNMPGRDGLDLIKDIKVYRPEIRILVLSMHSEDQYAVRAIKSGAIGYLTKNVSLNELIKTIKKALVDKCCINSSVALLMTQEIQNKSSNTSQYNTLSNREFQVFHLIASGKSISEIALKLSLSVKTIKGQPFFSKSTQYKRT